MKTTKTSKAVPSPRSTPPDGPKAIAAVKTVKMTYEKAIQVHKDSIAVVLTKFTDLLATLPTTQLPQASVFINDLEQVTKDIKDSIKSRIKDLVSAGGQVATDAGTKRMTVNGYVLEIQPSRTGLDPKAVETKLRAKGLDPEVGMDAEVKYKVNEGKLTSLVASGKMTQDEVETCRYPAEYKVMSPKKVE